MEPPRLLLFEPDTGGHHAGYVGHLMDAWRRWEMPGRLVVAGAPKLFDGRPDLRALGGPTATGRIDVIDLAAAEALPGLSLVRKGIAVGRLLRDTLRAEPAEQTLAMMGDHAQFALAFQRFPPPTRLSLLLLRVSHHRLPQTAGARARLTEARKRALLWLAARSPQAGVFLNSDPAAVRALEALGARSAYIPDPVPLPACTADRDAVRATYGIEPGRTLHLVYGALAERKGVLTVLRALDHLSEAAAAQTAVLFAGPVQQDIASYFAHDVAASQRRTRAQVVLHDAFLYEAETCALFEAADVVLAPYLGHAGTSSVLIRAAGAQRPAITQSQGLMAEQVAAHGLGQTVDATHAPDLARAMANPTAGFDATRARAFAETQTPDGYARATFEALGLLTS